VKFTYTEEFISKQSDFPQKSKMLCKICEKSLPAKLPANLKTACSGCGVIAHVKCVDFDDSEQWTCDKCTGEEPSLKDIMCKLIKMEKSMGRSLQVCHEKLDEQLLTIQSLTSAVDNLKEENTMLKNELQEVKLQVNETDQYSRRSTLKIQGVPESPGENVSTKVIQVGQSLGITIQPDKIDACHRLGKKISAERPRGIIVKFINRGDQENFIKQRKLRPMLNATDVFKDIPPSMNNAIFVNESLTPYNRKLYLEARIFKRENNYKYVWVKAGKIFLKKTDNSERHLIRSPEDILKLK